LELYTTTFACQYVVFNFGETLIENIPAELSSQYRQIQQLKEINSLNEEYSKNPGNTDFQMNIKKKLQILNMQMGQEKRDINGLVSGFSSMLKQKYIRRIKYTEISNLEQRFKEDTAKENSRQISFEQLIEKATKNLDYNELTLINKGAFKYLINLPHKLAADEIECRGDTTKFHDKISYKRFSSLKKHIKTFLNKDLDWTRKSENGRFIDAGYNVTYTGNFTLDNRVFNYQEFSDGEKILFTYIILFFLIEQNEKVNIKDSIIIIDEPELHLHPDSEIDLIDGLKKMISDKGQLIIATHSINILSTLKLEEVFVVKDGKIMHPCRKTMENSLFELINPEERMNKLSDLLYSVDRWAFVDFISQCFSDPEVIKSARDNDPQVQALKEIIKTKGTNANNVLLDFGAGKGRIYEQLKKDSDFFSKINYFALEPQEELHDDLKKLGIKNIYFDYTKLQNEYFDFILMCNVLHEIPIEKWEIEINHVIDALKSDGYLIIIEAKYLLRGEKIGGAGFIVLGPEEIQLLFNLSLDITSFYTEHDKDRITSVAVNKSDLKKITTDSIISALSKLKENELKNFELMRTQNIPSSSLYNIGRKTVFFCNTIH
jgi:hypothetical protein